MSTIVERGAARLASDFGQSMQSWIDAAPEAEREARQETVIRIVRAQENGNTAIGLRGLGLSSLPSQIGEVASLTHLDLAENAIAAFPPEMSNLTRLRHLILSNNSLGRLPTGIENLTHLTHLDLNNNSLRTTAGIENLTSLRQLNLQENNFTHISDALITSLPRGCEIDLEFNLLNAAEVERLNGLAQTSGVVVRASISEDAYRTREVVVVDPTGSILSMATHTHRQEEVGIPRLPIIAPERFERISNIDFAEDSSNLRNTLIQIITDEQIPNIDLTGNLSDLENAIRNLYLSEIALTQQSNITGWEDVVKKITNKAPSEEKKKELQEFFKSDDLKDFKRFLSQCSRTAGWQDKQDIMLDALFEIVDKMSQSESVKGKCESIAATAFGTCGDRVALAFIQMQLSLNISDKKLEEMNELEIRDYAKQESVVKFLTDKADEKIKQIKEQIKERGGYLDEIEVYLVYLQIGQDLGLNLKATDMLYQGFSHVTNDELKLTKEEFFKLDPKQRAAEYVHQDEYLSQHPFVQKIIKEVGGRVEFGADRIEGEADGQYLERVKELTRSFNDAVALEIRAGIKKAEERFIQNISQDVASLVDEALELAQSKIEAIRIEAVKKKAAEEFVSSSVASVITQATELAGSRIEADRVKAARVETATESPAQPVSKIAAKLRGAVSEARKLEANPKQKFKPTLLETISSFRQFESPSETSNGIILGRDHEDYTNSGRKLKNSKQHGDTLKSHPNPFVTNFKTEEPEDQITKHGGNGRVKLKSPSPFVTNGKAKSTSRLKPSPNKTLT